MKLKSGNTNCKEVEAHGVSCLLRVGGGKGKDDLSYLNFRGDVRFCIQRLLQDYGV